MDRGDTDPRRAAQNAAIPEGLPELNAASPQKAPRTPRSPRFDSYAALAFVIPAILVCGCRARTDRQVDRAFVEAREALRAGDLPGALSIADGGLALAGGDAGSIRAIRLRLLRCEVLISQRDLKNAEPLLSTPIPRSTQFQDLRARQKFLQARLDLARRNVGDALRDAEEGDRLAAAGGETALALGTLEGQLLFQLGRPDDAERRLNEAAREAARAGDRYYEAFAWHQLGTGMLVQSRYDAALPFFERVLSYSDVQRTAIYYLALNNAGICYSRLGLFDRAVEVQRRAVAFHEGRRPTREQSQALGQLGITYLLQGKRDGLEYLQQALRVANDARDEADATLWAGNLATASASVGEWDAAERYNDEAKALWQRTRSGRPVYNTLNSATIAAGRGRIDEADRLYEEVLASPDAPPSVIWEAHAGLADLAIARGRTADAVRHFDQALRVIEQTRAGLLKTDYKVSFLTQLITFYRAYVRALVDAGQGDRALEIADSSRGRVLAERQGTTAPARVRASAFVQRARQAGTVALSYWLTPDRSYLWVVTAAGTHLITLPPSADIERLVRRHQAAIASAMADPLKASGTAGEELYRLLVAPASRWIPPDARVVIVPDGALHGINFETLVVPGERRHYWIEDVEMEVAPSLASLTEAPAPPASGGMLLIGDATPRPPEFPALADAATEMSNVADHFPANRVERIDHERATPASYRAARPDRFAFIHFTAHATANVESPLDSAVVLSGPDNAYKLYARDVAGIPLDAELVIVSACRSAGERAYAGEGLVGFAWAFLRAGARRVIAGLWDVDDRSTAELMDLLYGRLAAHDPPARALRRAKLALLARDGAAARPYYWAPFELFTIAP